MDPVSPTRCCALLLFFLIAGQVCAQDYSFRTFSVEQGLSQSAVNAIIQDRDGFLWFGTQDGLNKFDGYSFLVYRHDREDSTTISDNYISCFLEDSRGVLWVGTYAGGLNRLDKGKGTFLRYRHSPGVVSGIGGNNVTGIDEDSAGALWISLWGGGVDRYDPRAEEWTHFGVTEDPKRSLSSINARALLIDRKGTVWIGTWDGLDALDPARGVVRHFRNDAGDPGSLPANRIVALFEDKDEQLWVSTYGDGLARYEPSEGSFVRYQGGEGRRLPSNNVGMIAQDQTGMLWISTRGSGLALLDPVSGAARHIGEDGDRAGGLKSKTIFSVYSDRTGAIWVGTDGSGLQHYDPHRKYFAHLQHIRNNPRGLSNSMVRSVCEDREGYVWIGSKGGGLDRFDPRTGEWKNFNMSSNPAIGDMTVLALMEDSRGNLWVGTDGGGISVFAPGCRSARQYRASARNLRSVGSDYVMTFCEGRDGSIWVGTSGGGLSRFDPRSRRFDRYLRRADRKGELSGNYVWAICEESPGTLWLGTWGAGLNRLDRSTGLFRAFRHDPSDRNSLIDNTIYCVYRGSDSVLWIGTAGGLDRFDPSTETFHHTTEKDGLPNNVISGILEDGSGDLWLSTNRGLCRLTPATGAMRTFDASDGLQSNEFNQGAYCKGRTGTMYFGGINGLSMFRVQDLSENLDPPPVVITRFRVLDRMVQIPHPAPEGISLSLEYGDKHFAFEFSALSYTAPEKNRFAYHLDGFDADWVDAGTRRYASYTNLDPGEYVFRVIAANNDGVWNQQGRAARVTIRPALWQMAWFRILAGAALGGAVVILFRRRKARIRRERLLEEGYTRRFNELQERERKDLAGTLHDSLGQELLLLKNELTLVGGRSDVSPELSEKLRSLSSSVQQSIEEVREISYDLHPHTLDRLGLQKALHSMVRKCEQASGIGFTAEIPPLEGLFTHFQEINIFRLLQEALNNVVRHSHAATCTVEVQPDGSELLIRVKDDGVGFDAETMTGSAPGGPSGFGLTSMTERVRLLRGGMHTRSSPGGGTMLEFRIPTGSTQT